MLRRILSLHAAVCLGLCVCASGSDAPSTKPKGKAKSIIPANESEDAPLPPAVSEEQQSKSTALYKEGLAIEKKKDLDSAISRWEEALRVDPRNAACMNHYAWFLAVTAPAERKNLDRALVLARRSAKASDWKNHDVLDTLAEVHFHRKEYAKAVEVQKKALQPGTVGNVKDPYLKKQLQKFEKALLDAKQQEKK